ncbi:MAG: hypothetical protein ACTHJN_19275 [Ginsengibacter sp.]
MENQDELKKKLEEKEREYEQLVSYSKELQKIAKASTEVIKSAIAEILKLRPENKLSVLTDEFSACVLEYFKKLKAFEETPMPGPLIEILIDPETNEFLKKNFKEGMN